MIDCDFDNPELTCPRCGFNVGKLGGAADWRKNCPLGTGQPVPGARLHILLEPLLEELKLRPRKYCGCAAYAQMMNAWGIAKCRERKAEIVEHLLAEANVTDTQLPFGVDLRELLGEMVEEACRLEEASPRL